MSASGLGRVKTLREGNVGRLLSVVDYIRIAASSGMPMMFV
jgi:hypothetical protein